MWKQRGLFFPRFSKNMCDLVLELGADYPLSVTKVSILPTSVMSKRCFHCSNFDRELKINSSASDKTEICVNLRYQWFKVLSKFCQF